MQELFQVKKNTLVKTLYCGIPTAHQILLQVERHRGLVVFTLDYSAKGHKFVEDIG